jgi:hypothetical protein
MEGKVFRERAQNDSVLQQKYDWLKENIFNGIEYDTGNPNWKNTANSFSQTGEVMQNEQQYSAFDINYTWDYQFPKK